MVHITGIISSFNRMEEVNITIKLAQMISELEYTYHLAFKGKTEWKFGAYHYLSRFCSGTTKAGWIPLSSEAILGKVKEPLSAYQM